MKHLLAILFVLSFSISSTRAQAKISLGIQSGINIPGLKIASINPVVDGYKTVLTPYFGVVMEAGINDKWSILTEVNYATMAITKDGSQVIPKSAYNNLKIDGLSFPSFLYANFYSKIQLNYIEVPMMLKYYFKENEKVNFFINGGPVAGILLHGHVKTVGFDKIYTDAAHTNAFTFFKAILTQDQNLGDRVKPINFGLQGL